MIQSDLERDRRRHLTEFTNERVSMNLAPGYLGHCWATIENVARTKRMLDWVDRLTPTSARRRLVPNTASSMMRDYILTCPLFLLR